MSYMQYVVVVPPRDGKVQDTHTWYCFPIDREGKDFDYRSRTSINAFFYGGNSRNWAPSMKRSDPNATLYHASEEMSFELESQLIECKLIKLDSVYEFFKVIGYDYKKKKYLKGNE